MAGGKALSTLWRQWRAWLLAGLIVLLGGVGVAVLHQPPSNPYLNPANVSAAGTHALADILTGLGHQVITTTSARDAERAATRNATLVITNPEYLTPAELAALGRVPASVVLVEPDAGALAAVASPLSLAGPAQQIMVTAPGCRLRAATLAGPADMGGVNLVVARPAAAPQRCYTSTSGATLVQLELRARPVTVLATGAPLTNARLASQGNAALDINLLRTHRIIWLVPDVATVTAAPNRGPKSFASLVPLAAYLVAIQLLLAVVLAATWRARRLGKIVTEPLPVVVRAAETTEGHGHLYQARHARAQAAEALRSAARGRLERVAGLPAGSVADAIVEATARRSSVPTARITELLFGPPPRTDQALVSLAGDLDRLEREAGTT